MQILVHSKSIQEESLLGKTHLQCFRTEVYQRCCAWRGYLMLPHFSQYMYIFFKMAAKIQNGTRESATPSSVAVCLGKKINKSMVAIIGVPIRTPQFLML